MGFLVGKETPFLQEMTPTTLGREVVGWVEFPDGVVAVVAEVSFEVVI
jgi:hypothetical protein